MNDFSKEELHAIINLIEVYCDGDSMVELSYSPFRSKVQSMIDNYCDHNLVNYCCGCDPENVVCDKCHRDLWGRVLK